MNRAVQRPGANQGVTENSSSDAQHTIRFTPRAAQWVEPIVLGWPQLILATSHSRRVLEGMMMRASFRGQAFTPGEGPIGCRARSCAWAEKAGQP